MSEPLRDVLLRHPLKAFRSQEFLQENWQRFNYHSCPDFDKACRDYDVFIDALRSSGTHVHFMDDSENAGIDSLYVHDPAITIGDGIVLCRTGKELRRSETEAFSAYCDSHDISVLGRIEAPGLLEGGDVIWLDEETLAVGLGYRTNEAGIEQLRSICADRVQEIISVPLPHFRGPGDVLHLMSLISPIGKSTAVVYQKLLPVPFIRTLHERKYTLIDIDETEYDALACNVLSLTPDRVLMAEGAPRTLSKIQSAGFDVLTYPPGEISLKGEGGPTCLTRPLVRR